MAFRAYFIRKSFTGIRKGQGRAFARPWPCVGGSASGNNAFRRIHSGSIRTNAARIVHIGDDLCTVHAGGKAHFVRQRGTACASGTEDENIVPGARPGLYVFFSDAIPFNLSKSVLPSPLLKNFVLIILRNTKPLLTKENTALLGFS